MLMSPRLILIAATFTGLTLSAGSAQPTPPPQPADKAAGPAPAPAPPPPDAEADGVVALLKGSFAATPSVPSESEVPLSWNAAPVELTGVPRAVYFEVARTDDPA